jgi:hypothetical protein
VEGLSRRGRDATSVLASPLGVGLEVRCPDELSSRTLRKWLGGFDGLPQRVSRRYRIERMGPSFRLARLRARSGTARPVGLDVLLRQLDHELTLYVQEQHPDLYFLHAAALALGNRVAALVAPSGGGKSTLACALLSRGLRYLSDELTPLEPRTLHVRAYPRALQLKTDPPAPLSLPEGTERSGGLRWIPVCSMPGPPRAAGGRLTVIVFLGPADDGSSPSVRRLTKAEAATRLYAAALNPLAHRHAGLAAATAVAARVPSFEVTRGELPAMCALVRGLLEQEIRRAPRASRRDRAAGVYTA